MDKVANYLSKKKFQNYCLSLVYYKICQTSTFVHPAAFENSVRDRQPLNAFRVHAERRWWFLNVLVLIPAFCKISDTHLASVPDDTGLYGGA